MSQKNVLFIVIDQLRADALNGPLAQCAVTPNLDLLASQGVSFHQHHTVTMPCGPSRASFLTGLYAMNHRAIRNGTPMASHHETIAQAVRRAGYDPLLFGYTDVSVDPTTRHPKDPDLRVYESVAPGFREVVEMRMEAARAWPAYLRQQGYDIPSPLDPDYERIFAPVDPSDIRAPTLYKKEHSDTAFLTDQTLAHLSLLEGQPWFAHVTYIRPHPPFTAPAPYNTLINANAIPERQMGAPEHPFLEAWFSDAAEKSIWHGFDGECRQMSEVDIRALRAVYLGLLAEVDHHVGRLLQWLDDSGQRDNTLVVLTADHGEMLGDKRQWGKYSVFNGAHHIPLIIRDPFQCQSAGQTIRAITESVDVVPTILQWLNQPLQPALDGESLLPWVAGEKPTWRSGAFIELDLSEPEARGPTRFQRHWQLSERDCNVAIWREEKWKYVHFNGGIAPMLFDLEKDPEENVDLASQPQYQAQLLHMAQAMLNHRMRHACQRLTSHSSRQ